MTLSGILMVVIVVISLLFKYSYTKLSEKVELNELVIEFNELSMTLHSMAERKRENLNQTFENDVKKIKTSLEKVELHVLNLKLPEEADFFKEFSEYKININLFVDNLLKLGLTENDGLEGEFRKNIHKLESYLKGTNDYLALIYLLQARRREKDFIIRHREEYVDQVRQYIKSLSVRLEKINNSKGSIQNYISNYLNSFEKYYQAYLSLKASIVAFENNQKNLGHFLKKRLTERHLEAENAYKMVFPVMFISIVLGIVFTLFYAQTITKPVNHLQKATLQVASGNLKAKVSIKTSDEFSQLADFFNRMVWNLEQNSHIILKKNKELEEINQELKVLNSTKDRLFSIIAHDLKNPVASFKSLTDYLSKNYHQFSEEERIEFVHELNNSAIAVYDLLENLLQWAFMQMKRTPFNPQSFDLNFLIKTTINHLSLQAKNKKITVNNQVNEEIVVYADVFMVSTVVRNLLSNAIKFTKEGGVVNISCKKNETYCIVSVQDNGIGIPKEIITNLFKVDNNISRRGTSSETGTGLGLILCKEFVENNKGKIWVESEVNLGTTVHFTLPLSQ